MKKLQMRQMEGLQGGGYDGACGFMAAIAVVAIFSTGPLAPATGGLDRCWFYSSLWWFSFKSFTHVILNLLFK